MSKTFIEEIRELVALLEESSLDKEALVWELVRKLIAIAELSKKWLKGHTEEEWYGEQIQKILEGEQK